MGELSPKVTERASPLKLFVLLLHLGALIHIVELYSGGLHICVGDIRGDDAVAVQILAGKVYCFLLKKRLARYFRTGSS